MERSLARGIGTGRILSTLLRLVLVDVATPTDSSTLAGHRIGRLSVLRILDEDGLALAADYQRGTSHSGPSPQGGIHGTSEGPEHGEAFRLL